MGEIRYYKESYGRRFVIVALYELHKLSSILGLQNANTIDAKQNKPVSNLCWLCVYESSGK